MPVVKSMPASGLYVLSYNYTDAAGNAAQTVTRTIEVVDTTVPVIILNGDSQYYARGRKSVP